MKILLFSIALISLTTLAAAQDITLTWDAVEDPRLSSYVIYMALNKGDHSGPWTATGEVKAPQTEYAVTLNDKENYLWYVTAKDVEGHESQASNIVRRYSNRPLGVPGNFRRSQGD